MAGVAVNNPLFPQEKSPPFSQFGDPASFGAAARTNASDYDKIMAQYDQLANSSPISVAPIGSSNVGVGGRVSYNSITPQTSQYKQSEDVTGSLANLSDLATKGGYSEEDKQNLRARGISPTRSIYANAQENVDRSRRLQGGYSPNFNAVQAKMARDESSQIGDINTNVNAGIAQNVASNRLSAAPSYSSAAGAANAAQTAADARNAAIVNEINQENEKNRLQAGEFNASMGERVAEGNANRATETGRFNVQSALDAAKFNRNSVQGAIQGKASLYGTTPALTNTFGNQVIQAGQLGQGQQQINNQKQRDIYGLARLG